jgi:hypothetical protein
VDRQQGAADARLHQTRLGAPTWGARQRVRRGRKN